MKNHALSFGLALIIIGLFGYFNYDPQSGTALIPAGFGLALILSGLCSTKEGCHKHAMHAAATIALLGAAGAGVMAVKGLSSADDAGGEAIKGSVLMQSLMALVCLVFVVLCVKSFMAAREAREADSPEASKASEPGEVTTEAPASEEAAEAEPDAGDADVE